MLFNIILFSLFPLVMGASSRNVFISVFSWIVVLFLISLRGEYGSDTWSYYVQVKDFSYTNLSAYSLLQPLWLIFQSLLNIIGAGSSLLMFNFAVGVVFVLLFWCVVRSKPLNTAILAFLPILIVDLAMNTHRAGIALLFLVLLRNSYFTSIAPLIHVSTAPITMYQYFKSRSGQSLLLLVPIVLVVFYFGQEFLALAAPIIQHVELYSNYGFGSEYRGLTDVAIIFLLANSALYSGKVKFKVIIMSLCLCYVMFHLASINYGFLRFTKLVMYYYVLTNTTYDSTKISRLGFRASLKIFYIFSAIVFNRIIMGFGIYGV